MNRDKISLTIQDILEKEFKIDARGYRLQEVDKFLDIIIRDYNEYNNMIRNLEKEKKALAEENQELKQEVRNLKSSIEAVKLDGKEIVSLINVYPESIKILSSKIGIEGYTSINGNFIIDEEACKRYPAS